MPIPPLDTPIPLTYRYFRKLKYAVVFTAVALFLFELANLFREGYGDLRPLFEGRIWDYIKDLLGYYYVFELISALIFFALARAYFKWLKLDYLQADAKALILYIVKTLPLVLFSIPLFAPITNGIRYLVWHYPNYSINEYFPEYFLHAEMYVRYLVPLLIFFYVFLFINAFQDFYEWQFARSIDLSSAEIAGEDNTGETEKELDAIKNIQAYDEKGSYWIDLDEIWWFEVEEKTYYLYTEGKTLEVKHTLSELEEMLPEKYFFRINRSVLVHLGRILGFRYWEHDKYKVLLKDERTEFVIQRKRLKELKERLSKTD